MMARVGAVVLAAVGLGQLDQPLALPPAGLFGVAAVVIALRGDRLQL